MKASRIGPWALGLALLSGLGLTGCASVAQLGQQLGQGVKETLKPGSASAVRRVAEYELEVHAPAPLRKLLLEHLDLARFREAPEEDRLSPLELSRLAGSAPQQARALLETEGHFNAKVDVERLRDPSRVIVKVEPGAQARVRHVLLQVDGAMAAPDEAHGQALRQALMAAWALPEGRPFTQAAWSAAKSAWLTQARAQGYPLASISDSGARVQTETDQVDLHLTLDSGPLFRLGALQIDGLKHHPRSVIDNLAGFQAGEPYAEKTLLDLQERLVRTGLFDSVTVEIRPETDAPEASPVWVKLRESLLQNATLSLGYSTVAGPRIGLEHLHRHPFGLDLRAKTDIRLGTEQRLFKLELSSHPKADRHRHLGSFSLHRERSDGVVNEALVASLGRMRETDQDDRYLHLDLIRGRDRYPDQTVNTGAWLANVHWTRRRVDSTLLPTLGHTASLRLGLGRADSSTEASGPLALLHARAQVFRPLSGQWQLNARAEAAQLLARNDVGIPDVLRFRTGGDESVRGYGPRELHPVDAKGRAIGGRVMWNGSIELSHPIYEPLPALLGAGFVDAGQAAMRWRELNTVWSAGLGLRYRSPLGLLRLDVARALSDKHWRLHFSVGMAL